MTKKKIVVEDRKGIKKLEKGMILKKNGEMFIVAKIDDRKYDDSVDVMLFSSIKSGNVVEYAKYALISLMTGDKYFKDLYSLSHLHMLVEKHGFKIVEEVEFREIQ
jgi:hypothetical protein